jgi:probable rRNA maturation factor
VNDHPPSPQTRRRNTSDAGSTPASLTVLVIDDRDERTALPVDEPRWIALASAVLADLGPAGAAELAISFVDEPAIAELNERFMGHEGPTDVLSFPIDDTPPPVEVAELPRLLGDIVICPGVAARNAPQHAGTFEDEIALLVVHGILHLLGMDHEVDDDRVVMQQRERELLTAHHGSPARDPWS